MRQFLDHTKVMLPGNEIVGVRKVATENCLVYWFLLIILFICNQMLWSCEGY